MRIDAQSFTSAREQLEEAILERSKPVHTESWQGIDISKRPEMRTHELLNVSLEVPLGGVEYLGHWRRDVRPNLPWADDHFAERVCGAPINPGREWLNWPWGKNAEKFLDANGQFNHNYMERYWPRNAAQVKTPTYTPTDYWQALDRVSHTGYRVGLRGCYGDLESLVRLLADEPLTRQAWLPIFFPEDTGNADGNARKPCTLGYQIIVREERAHIFYPLRSCDFVRHYHDDVYMTIRLLLWVIEQCRSLNPYWKKVRPGTYTMHMTSLHVFENDMRELGQ